MRCSEVADLAGVSQPQRFCATSHRVQAPQSAMKAGWLKYLLRGASVIRLYAADLIHSHSAWRDFD